MEHTNKSFRIRFNNHKSSFKRYGEGQRSIFEEHLYVYFWKEDQRELEEILVPVIDVTDVRDPTHEKPFGYEYSRLVLHWD